MTRAPNTDAFTLCQEMEDGLLLVDRHLRLLAMATDAEYPHVRDREDIAAINVSCCEAATAHAAYMETWHRLHDCLRLMAGNEARETAA